MKKGFTLIELLGVIALLGLLGLILVPAVDTAIKNGKEKAYGVQVDTIKIALTNWYSDNKYNLPDYDYTKYISLEDLKYEGYIDFEFKNPKTGNCFSNNSMFQIDIINDIPSYIIEDGLFDSSESSNCVPQLSD